MQRVDEQLIRIARAAMKVARLVAVALLAQTALSSAAAQPIRQYQFEPADGGYTLALKEVERPEAAANEVLVRVHAVSLNRRDVLMLNARYGDEVQPVNVLRDEEGDPAGPVEVRQREVRVVRPSPPRRMFQPPLPRLTPNRGVRDVVADVAEPRALS